MREFTFADKFVHSDHKTVGLHVWHRVFMNTESRTEPTEAAKVLETSQRALAIAREELSDLRNEEATILGERRDAAMNGSPLGPVEKRLQSVQSKVGLLIGRCEQLAAVVEEYRAKAAKEQAASARKKLDALQAEINEAVKRAEAELMLHVGAIAPLLEAKAKAEALTRQAAKILRL